MSDFENKYNDERLPSYEETIAMENIAKERMRLIAATSELARIKTEMEEKIRKEMENKIRKEIEEKMKEEMVKEELKKKNKELEEIKRKLHEEVINNFQKWTDLLLSQGTNHSIMYNSVKEIFQKEKVLFYTKGGRGWNNFAIETYLYVSDKNVNILCLFRDCKTNNPSFFIENRPIYTFDSELERRHIKILNQVFQEPVSSSKNPIIGENIMKVIDMRTICDGILGAFQYNSHDKKYVISCLKSTGWARPFETIIQLIPGGYKNSPWIPLNGFFGMYFNEDTCEISPIPPIVE